MKRIILILALLSLGVSKAQVVGGYLPLNSTKSATMGGLRVNGNETVTGTFSVGSTATITGALKASSTMSLGSANLTGGNTGTVAVLSDVPFIMPLFAAVIGGGSSPADGTSYYIGYSGGWSGAATNASVTVPYNCTLRQAEVHAFVNGTVGSAESVTLAIQGTTNYTITSTMTYSLGGENRVVSTGISQDFAAGDVIYLRQFSPTWATNPTQVAIGVLLTFTRRP